MKKCVPFTFIVFALVFQSCAGRFSGTSTGLADGEYRGESRSIYTSESYWGEMSFTVRGGKLLDFSFGITDRNLKMPFDAAYEKVFAGNPLYVQQARNDWAGVQAYSKKFRETGDISKVDAVAGATWSYNMFRDTYAAVLKK